MNKLGKFHPGSGNDRGVHGFRPGVGHEKVDAVFRDNPAPVQEAMTLDGSIQDHRYQECPMPVRLPPSNPILRVQLHRGRLLFALVLAAAFMAVAHTLVSFQSDSIPAAGLLFLPLVLLGALSAGRELLTPSLRELAFYSSAIVAALLIWPASRLAMSAYEASGFAMLAGFMGCIFALAVALGVLAVKLLSRHDGEM